MSSKVARALFAPIIFGHYILMTGWLISIKFFCWSLSTLIYSYGKIRLAYG